MTGDIKTSATNYTGIRWFAAGILFAALWASAAVATKIGLKEAQPLVIAVTRFGAAALIMLSIAYGWSRSRLPKGKEWKQLAIYGLLNITIYLGLYVIAMQHITAGIGSLAIASNPVFISFFSVFFLKKPLKPVIIVSLIICTIGVICAAWPLLGDATVSVEGLILLFLSMAAYSVSAIYFSAKQWNNLPLLVINGWQTLIGGILLLPLALFYYKSELNHLNLHFTGAVLWLAVPVSIFAVSIWLWLLKMNPVRAGLWLFLCPLFGFIFAAWITNDVISIYTLIGVVLVLGGLFIARMNAKKEKVEN